MYTVVRAPLFAIENESTTKTKSVRLITLYVRFPTSYELQSFAKILAPPPESDGAVHLSYCFPG